MSMRVPEASIRPQVSYAEHPDVQRYEELLLNAGERPCRSAVLELAAVADKVYHMVQTKECGALKLMHYHRLGVMELGCLKELAALENTGYSAPAMRHSIEDAVQSHYHLTCVDDAYHKLRDDGAIDKVRAFAVTEIVLQEVIPDFYKVCKEGDDEMERMHFEALSIVAITVYMIFGKSLSSLF